MPAPTAPIITQRDDQRWRGHAAHPDAPQRERARPSAPTCEHRRTRAAGVAVGQRSGQRPDDRRREERAERADPDPHRRMGELVEHVRHRDGLHPRAGVREQRGREEEARSRGGASPPAHRPRPFVTVRIYPRGTRTGVRLRMGVVVPGQRSLFAAGDPAVDADARWERVDLGGGSWVDIVRGYLARRRHAARSPRRRACPGVPGVARCTTAWSTTRACRSAAPDRDPVPHPALARVRGRSHRAVPRAVRRARAQLLPRRSRQRGLPPRSRAPELDDALVVILTLGAARPFRIRPFRHAGTRSRDLAPGSGDLLVMGGACQTRMGARGPEGRPRRPRVSAMWRWARR